MRSRPPPNVFPPTVPPVPARRPPVVQAGVVTLVLVGGLWLQEITDQVAFGGALDVYGIQPRNSDALGHIFSAPFLHGGFGHLLANTVPVAVLAFMSALHGLWRFLLATLMIVALGGALVWLFGRGGSVHLGASELVFGYLAYLLGAGWWERSASAIIAAAVALLLYGGALWGVLPSNPEISWESHLFGFVAGVVAAAVLHRKKRVVVSG
ncbi:rhomboid family intramembrane serine protease [Deinococcus sp. Arct2-2]|uniref:rhomboid family intramembrane serine protease n=1 Tax=Deinococcus sp. Arct2-2 TaxID=2568653 RepID=UPI0010A531DF|nr:rhomboid family intramembrane serine protease [Deinococcus sp. Arct2-2]THF69254.1 rhomboid family intramembrane serine protease [Deinococcus sp. Arct2-2]